jgi:hypothetical protein
MKKITILLVLALSLFGLTAAHAAPTAELKTKGISWTVPAAIQLPNSGCTEFGVSFAWGSNLAASEYALARLSIRDNSGSLLAYHSQFRDETNKTGNVTMKVCREARQEEGFLEPFSGASPGTVFVVAFFYDMGNFIRANQLDEQETSMQLTAPSSGSSSSGPSNGLSQKTLASFSSTATTLTNLQRSQVKAAVEANPNATKFICTGIRYVSQPMSENIKVRKRAKAACDYAKTLNPELSTWYQNKPTEARSYAGKVLLTVKSPASIDLEGDQQIVTPELTRVRAPEFLNAVAGDVAGFSSGEWESGWAVTSVEFFACEWITSTQGWEALLDNPSFCEPLPSGLFDGIASLPQTLAGQFLFARLKLGSTGPSSSQRQIHIGGPEVLASPMWGRLPKLMGSQIVGQGVYLDVDYSPSGYEVLNESAIWACSADSPQAAISEFRKLLSSGACDWLGDMSSQPIIIRESAQGKYLVGDVAVASERTNNKYLQTTWQAWQVQPSSISNPGPTP